MYSDQFNNAIKKAKNFDKSFVVYTDVPCGIVYNAVHYIQIPEENETASIVKSDEDGVEFKIENKAQHTTSYVIIPYRNIMAVKIM